MRIHTALRAFAFAIVVWLAAVPVAAYVSVNEPHANAHTTLIDGYGYQYIVALKPPHTEGVVEPPLTTTAIDKYCAAADEWARRVYEATDGIHRIFRVHFYRAENAPPLTHVNWYRQNGVPRVTQWGQHQSEFRMYDNIRGCLSDWQVENGEIVDAGPYCADSEYDCIDDVASLLGRLYCADDGVPVERPASDWGWTLAHETGHWFHALNDEYFNEAGDGLPNFQVCVGDPETNNGTDETSMMGSLLRNHWCDEVTHLESRNFDGVIVENPSLSPAWDIAPDFWPELGVHIAGTYPDVHPENLDPVECVVHFAVDNDALLLLDRSGSMSYEDAETGQTALQQAVEAALGFFNTTEVDRSSGVFGFNDTVTPLIPYAPFDGTTVEEIDVAPEGSTNLCTAITTAADAVRAAHPNEAHGSAILLSDGLPTVPGCQNGAQVLEAAWEACFGGAYPVTINTLAFGDADGELLFDVATMCGGEIWMTGQESQIELPPPHHIKTDIARMAYDVRNRTAVMYVRREFNQIEQVELLHVPEATRRLEVAWLGDGKPGCNLANLAFELISPTGVVHPAETESPVGSDELNYHSRTVRVSAPEHGLWRARIREPGPSFQCFPVGPDFAWLGEIDHPTLEASATPEPAVAPRNTPIVLEATLRFPVPHTGTQMSAAATILRDGVQWALPLNDDGAGGDALAGDGVYSGTFNPEGYVIEPGTYSARIGLSATEGSAVTVLEDGGTPWSTLPPPAAARGSARVFTETSFILQDCCDPAINAPPHPSYPPCSASLECTDDVVADIGTLAPATSYVDLGIDLVGHVVGRTGVRVGLGSGIEVGNVTSSYNPSTETSQLRFAATVDLRAPDGPRQAVVRYGHKLFRVENALNVVGSPAGAVPDGGSVPGIPLRVRRSGASNLEVSWGRSCNTSDSDYAIYEGVLGDFASHAAKVCTTSGNTRHIVTPAAGNAYYLVVPLSENREGSYGVDSHGRERSQGSSSCRVQSFSGCP